MANYAEIEREAKIYLDQCVHNDRIDRRCSTNTASNAASGIRTAKVS